MNFTASERVSSKAEVWALLIKAIYNCEPGVLIESPQPSAVLLGSVSLFHCESACLASDPAHHAVVYFRFSVTINTGSERRVPVLHS